MNWVGRMFLIAALFNLSFGAALVFPDFVIGTIMGRQNLPTEAIGSLWMAIALWLVVCFGLLYLATAFDPKGNRPVILVGAIGKIGVFVIGLMAWRAGVISTLLFGAACADLVFGILFLAVLLGRHEA